LDDSGGGAGELAEEHPVEFTMDARPGVVAGLLAGVLGDPDQHERKEAQGDVGADAVLLAVLDGRTPSTCLRSRQNRSTSSSPL
jgi:hypothetical protein